MNQSKSIPHVGVQIPDMKNSPIADDTDEEIYVLRQEIEEQPYCYFNDDSYDNGSYVQSGIIKKDNVTVRVAHPLQPSMHFLSGRKPTGRYFKAESLHDIDEVKEIFQNNRMIHRAAFKMPTIV